MQFLKLPLICRRWRPQTCCKRFLAVQIPYRGICGSKMLAQRQLDLESETVFGLDEISVNVPKPEPIEEGITTDFYKTIKSINAKFSNRIDGEYVILIQVGSFYELYYEQAEKYSSLLGIKFTYKQTKMGPVPFSGFPDHSLNKFLPIIFKNGLKTVICKQVENDITGHISRPIDRLVTPGTIIDDVLRDYHKNNFALALSFPEDYLNNPEGKKIGVAWCDVNLGIFSYVEATYNTLLATLTRIDPSEVIITNKIDLDELLNGRWFPELIDLKRYYITQFNPNLSSISTLGTHIKKFNDNERLIKSIWDRFTLKEKNASLMLLNYLDFCIPNHNLSFNLPIKDLPKTIMKIDPRAAEDLELIQTIQSKNRVGTLAHIMDRTVTTPGSRLLNSWLLAPSTNTKEIKQRHDLIESFLKNQNFMSELVTKLKNTCDITRILKRIDNDSGNFDDYLELAKTIKILKEIWSDLKLNKDQHLTNRIDVIMNKFMNTKKIHKLSRDLLKTIDPVLNYTKSSDNFFGKTENETVRTYWNIRKDSSLELHKLRDEYDALVEEYYSMHSKFKGSIRELGYNGSYKFSKDFKTFQYIIEFRSTSKCIPKIIRELKLEIFEKSKTVTKINYPQWTRIGKSLVELEIKITKLENDILKNYQVRIRKMYQHLRLISPIIEKLDVIQSFTTLTRELNLKKPIIDSSETFNISKGRHLIVEEGLRHSNKLKSFVSNDLSMDSEGLSWVITGPNMGGKSTFLRQNALIAILAQIGSYVPADYAHIGIIDKIFTRVGSSDNIYKHQSTFMVEMNETANILREATPKSLVIIDELGRGTSTKEGISIAYASLNQLVLKNKSKVLFATHFGLELSELIKSDSKLVSKIEFYKTDLIRLSDEGFKPIDERIIFNHKLIKGISEYSHALDIAHLAGFPTDTLKLAQKTLNNLK